MVQAYKVIRVSQQLRRECRVGADEQGGITTTLGALSRLIDDYDSMARKEMVTAAREKANT